MLVTRAAGSLKSGNWSIATPVGASCNWTVARALQSLSPAPRSTEHDDRARAGRLCCRTAVCNATNPTVAFSPSPSPPPLFPLPNRLSPLCLFPSRLSPQFSSPPFPLPPFLSLLPLLPPPPLPISPPPLSPQPPLFHRCRHRSRCCRCFRRAARRQ